MGSASHDRLWIEYAIARLNVVKGDFIVAISGLEPIWPYCESKFPVYIPRVASSLGVAYAASGAIDNGLTLLRQADEQSRSSGFRFGYALVLSQLAEVLLMAGQDVEAHETALRAVEMARIAGERGNEGWAACVLGDTVARCTKPVDAKTYYVRALEIAEALSMKPLHGRCLNELRR